MTNAVIKEIKEKIKEKGWAMANIFMSETEPGFVYTNGLQKNYEHPEIIVFGLPHETAFHFVEHIVEKIKKG